MRLLVPLACLLLTCGVPASAQTPQPQPQPVATSQFYLLSFEDAPVAEVAEAVVGGALSQTVSVDPALDATVSFQVEGAFTPQALLEEFGTAALDADLALVRSRAGDLAVLPRGDLARELARGGVLVARPEPSGAARASAVAAPVRAPITYGEARWWDGAAGGFLLFLGGVATGALALRGGQEWARRRQPASVTTTTRLTYQPMPMAEAAPGDPELIIPRFETRERD